MTRKFKTLALLVGAALALAGCASEAEVADWNTSEEADNFNVPRRITLINGITGERFLTVEGYCSVKADGADKQFEAICKVDGRYKKILFGLANNTPYMVEPLEPIEVSGDQYKVIWRPSTLLPDIDLR